MLHLLEKLSVEPLSASEYATRTSAFAGTVCHYGIEGGVSVTFNEVLQISFPQDL